MRNLQCTITDMRKKVFAEVAKLAYEGGDYYTRMEKLPYELMPGEVGTVRESIFLERAIVGERIRLAMGLPLRDVSEHTLLSNGVEESAIAEKYYDPPLINIIKYACHACPDTHYEVTNACQGCLARHCSHACPKGAIHFEHGQAQIDQTKCIKCGKCKAACSYQAIIKFFRPCQEACGMDAIGKDDHGRAQINHDKCVNCGMCLVNCPFGAIVDKGQLFQLIHAIRGGAKVIAIIAPAFWGQFGEKVTPGQIKAAMKELGFAGLEEVAVGADLCAIEEAEEFLRVVPEKQPFMATSCCPAWSVMAKKEFPGFAPYISMTMTPMVLTARLQKRRNPDCKIAFIGPCAAKKLEASRRSCGACSRPRTSTSPRSPTSRPSMRPPPPAWALPPAAAWPRRWRRSLRSWSRIARSRPCMPRACGSAARCCAWPAPGNTTAICWRAWPAPAAASPVPVPSSRRRSPAVCWSSTRPRPPRATPWNRTIPSICRSSVRMRRTGTPWPVTEHQISQKAIPLRRNGFFVARSRLDRQKFLP